MKKNVFWALLCCTITLLTGCASTPDSSLLPDTNNRPYSTEVKPQECTLPEATEKRNTQEHFTLEQKVGDLSQKIDDLKTEVAKKEVAPARAKFKHIYKYKHEHKHKPCNCIKDGSKKEEPKKAA